MIRYQAYTSQNFKTIFLQIKAILDFTQKISSRDTCLCKLHVNFGFLIQKLYHLKVLPSLNTSEFISLLTCNPKSKKCMYRECDICNSKEINTSRDGFLSTFYYE